jgi:hypothetical protein
MRARSLLINNRTLIEGAPLAGFVRKLAPASLIALVSAFLAMVIIQTNGNAFTAFGLLVLLGILFISAYKTVWGFYVFILFVLLFDQFGPPGFSDITSQTYFFSNLNIIPYLPRFDQGVVNPLEILLFLIVSSWLVAGGIRRELKLTPVKNGYLLLFFLVVVMALGYGMSRGGDFVISLWETRAFFYMGLMLLFLPQIITTRKDVESLVWIFIVAISFKAFQGAYRFASLGFSFGRWPNIYETLTNHEDPVFSVTLFVLLVGLVLFKANQSQRRTLQWLSIILVIGFVAGQRRAAYASLMASMCVVIVLLDNQHRKAFLKGFLAFTIVFGLYLAAFWNSENRLGSVAKQFRSTVTGEGGVRGEKDNNSTLYRLIENYNLAYTFRSSPAIGRGFGMPFDTPLRLWTIDINKLGKYMPHNQILWIFVKTGVVGALVFWMFFNSFVFRGTRVFVKLTDPYLKAVCLMCVAAVVNQLVVSYVDMQLTWYRNMIYLGALLALITVIEQLDRLKQQEAA